MILVFFVAQNLVIVVAAAARVGSWKYLKDPSGEHLFDLSTDPGEKSDLRTGKREQFEMSAGGISRGRLKCSRSVGR